MSDMIGKVALITGASSGIGAKTAIHFASLGCKLSICGRNKSNLQSVSEQCVAAGLPSEDVLLLTGDMSKEEDVITIMAETIKYYKKLDILINSAGIISTGTTENTSLESYDTLMNINVRSLFHMMQLAIPHLKETKGNIVNVSSVAGLRAFPGVMAYCVSKAAVDQLTRTAALELSSYGIRVNSVNPGVIATELHKRGGMSEEDYEKFLKHSNETHALGRPGTTDEVAHAIAFLASELSASFITGVSLPVDGGRGQMCPR